MGNQFWGGATKGLPQGATMGLQFMQMGLQRKQVEDQLQLQREKNWLTIATGMHSRVAPVTIERAEL